MRRGNLVTALIIIAVIVLAVYAMTRNNANTDEELAKCIGSKSTLYIQKGCFACQKQEELFGETYKYLNVVDCLVDRQKCIDKEITATPTWVINNEKLVGVRTIEKLKELTNC